MEHFLRIMPDIQVDTAPRTEEQKKIVYLQKLAEIRNIPEVSENVEMTSALNWGNIISGNVKREGEYMPSGVRVYSQDAHMVDVDLSDLGESDESMENLSGVLGESSDSA